MFHDLVARAQSAQLGAKMFATKEAKFSSSLMLYSLDQCTPDISSFDCNKCLRGAIAYLPNRCSGKQGAMGLYTSCTVRYDVHPFYRIIPSPPLPPPPHLHQVWSREPIMVIAKLTTANAKTSANWFICYW